MRREAKQKQPTNTTKQHSELPPISSKSAGTVTGVHSERSGTPFLALPVRNGTGTVTGSAQPAKAPVEGGSSLDQARQCHLRLGTSSGTVRPAVPQTSSNICAQEVRNSGHRHCTTADFRCKIGLLSHSEHDLRLCNGRASVAS